MDELKKLIQELGQAFEEYKKTHAQQLAEQLKGKADSVLNDKLEKLSARIDDLVAKKEELEKKLNRPRFEETEDARNEQKAVVLFNQVVRAHAQEKSRPMPAEITVEGYRQYKQAFIKMIRGGGIGLDEADRKAMSVGVDSDGGYLVPPDVSGRISTKLFDLSPIRQIANVQVISSDRLEGMEDLNEAGAGWVGETETRSDTSTPAVGAYEIPVHEMYASPKATQKLLDDAAVDIEAWLSGKVSDKLARLEGAAFVVGNGVKKPKGFTAYSTAATGDSSRDWGTFEHVMSGASADFAASNPADKLFDLEGAFKPGYLANARWVTRRSVIVKIRKFKGSDNNYLWQPGLAAGKPATLIGYPITMAEDMPALAADSLSLALGDFNVGYQIVDRLGIRTLRDPFTDKPYVKFYTTKRTGGGAVNFEAIKFLKFNT